MTVDHQLRDGTLTRGSDNLFGGTGRGLDVNFFERNIVRGQKAFGRPAVGTPEGGVERNLNQQDLTTVDPSFHRELIPFPVRDGCAR